MSMSYIRKTYGVPCKRGARVKFCDPGFEKEETSGVVTSVEGCYIRIRFNGDKKTFPIPFHPTWMITWMDMDSEYSHTPKCDAALGYHEAVLARSKGEC